MESRLVTIWHKNEKTAVKIAQLVDAAGYEPKACVGPKHFEEICDLKSVLIKVLPRDRAPAGGRGKTREIYYFDGVLGQQENPPPWCFDSQSSAEEFATLVRNRLDADICEKRLDGAQAIANLDSKIQKEIDELASLDLTKKKNRRKLRLQVTDLEGRYAPDGFSG